MSEQEFVAGNLSFICGPGWGFPNVADVKTFPALC